MKLSIISLLLLAYTVAATICICMAEIDQTFF